MKANKIILLAGLIILSSCNSAVSSTNNPTSSTNAPTSVDLNSNVNLSISLEKNELYFGEWSNINLTIDNEAYRDYVTYEVSNTNAVINKNQVLTLALGSVDVVAKVGNNVSNSVTVSIVDYQEDPYASVTKDEFYANYKPAISYKDSYYRTQHSFMSGDIADQDQNATILKEQPKENDKLVKNITYKYSVNKEVYYIYDYKGYVVDAIFAGGAYVSLEEVAQYVTAFNDIPSNYTTNKSGSPSSNAWGKYLRLNHSKFSGDTSKYPYEPVLPNISGCGGTYNYYELDIGTTGTDCDPSYSAVMYNNGSKITRGAARIVYSRYNGSAEIDIRSKYVFYTNNHYNDFREYLNYQNGWGEIFGNITGGGIISSKTNYNPTDYVDVVRKEL